MPIRSATRVKADPAPEAQSVSDPGQSEAELRALLSNLCTDEQLPAEEEESVLEGLTIPLLKHQVTGVNWMKWQEASTSKGGILADDMGLGKIIFLKSRFRGGYLNAILGRLCKPLH
ncbi:uncharacterized protein BYT42DRAFT_545157 [Radiomyces spectabilis]|uniref:uncharacterized protein n=1 Tax=Radiomyces spectabilis TaxID=64574 RepID=UPI0022211788|nr:uncharacterized protein BYT42DRAFT_545157 [Radiomyces spectabilis]KAI8381232.1 hypothetical protein BYT42DRAFT_545157 [Radiomyces spectabilis]